MKSIRIMLVGSDQIFSIENFYVRYMRKHGANVYHFNAQRLFRDYYGKGIVNKILFRLGVSGIYSRINKNFREVVTRENPEVIWIFKGMELFPESLRWAKGKGIKLVNYNPDNPFIFTGKGSGNKNITNSLSLYDLHFTYNLAVQNELQKRSLGKTAVLPFGFEISQKLFDQCVAVPEVNGVCFLGNPDPARARFLVELAEAGIAIAIYGHHWEKFVSHKNIRLFDAVYGDEFWKVLRQYRVQINLMRVHNLDSHNMRSFEVPGVGGIMLAPDTVEHRIYFDNEKEAFLFQNTSDAIRIIQRLLTSERSYVDAVRAAARARSLRDGYSYEARSVYALSEIHKLVR